MLKLVDLPEEVFLDILSRCDVVTILIFEQTCRDVRRLALSRQLWITLAQDLDYERAPSLLPHESIQSLTTERLREILIRSTRGYLNWSSPQGPKATRSITMDLREDVDYHKLVPGGKYYFLRDHDGYFHCYDTQRQTKLWSHRRAKHANEFIRSMDCAMIDDNSTLILALIIAQYTDYQAALIVIRIDLQSGASETVLSPLLPFTPPHIREQLSFMSELSRVKIANETVVAWSPGSFMVGNWRTGDLAIIEELGDVHSIDIIQNHLLCAINWRSRGYFYAAAPISHIFSEANKLGRTKSSAPHVTLSVRSQDAFTIVLPLAIPDLKGRTASTTVKLISVCSSSWKHPNVSEFDDQAASTRIVLSLGLFFGPEEFVLTFQLQFAPKSILPPNGTYPTTSGGDGENGRILTCQRQSPLYSYDRDFSGRSLLTSTTRTGRAFGSLLVVDDNQVSSVTRNIYTINVYEFLGRATHDPDVVVPMARMIRRSNFSRLADDLITDCDDDARLKLMVDEYSGALWYRRGKTLFIHHFD